MSVSKPFVFALVCEALGAERARERLGVNGTGLPFNSLEAVERSGDGRTNPMVNPGAIAATSLVPGRPRSASGRRSTRACRASPAATSSVNEEVYRSASATNDRNQAIAGLLERLRPRSTAIRPRRPTSTRGSAP